MKDKEYDHILLKRIKQDPEVFIELYDQYYLEILNFMYYRISHRQVAEDLTSDVFHKAFKSVFKMRKLKHSFSAWLYTIARNTLYSYFRKKKVGILNDDIELSDNHQTVHQDLIDREKDDDSRQVMQDMHKAISELPEKYHEVLTLFYYEQYSINKIATHLHISPGAVKTRLSRGREKLRKNYAESR
jgi:RNA polymerase sigma-70 factor (ECF subfamily)